MISRETPRCLPARVENTLLEQLKAQAVSQLLTALGKSNVNFLEAPSKAQ
jgi:hypothetical protein